MDPKRFDGLVRSLARPAARRSVLGAVAGGVLAQLTPSGAAVAGGEPCTPPGGRCRKAAVCCPAAPNVPNTCKKKHGKRRGKCGPCATGRIALSNGTCALPCPNGPSDCLAAGCTPFRCLATDQGPVCLVDNAAGACASNAACPPGRACDGTLCEIAC
jgi:hypothetical protein